MTVQPSPAPKRRVGRPALGKTRVLISIEPDLLADLDAEAGERSMTRSAVISERVGRMRWRRT